MFFLLLFQLFSLPLTQSSSAEPCQSVVEDSTGPVSVQSCAGVHVVRLEGTPVERAKKLGELLKAGTLSPDVVRYFSHKIRDITYERAGWLGGPALLLYHQLVRLFHSEAPLPLEEEVDAMASGMGLDPIVLRRGLSLPDTVAFLQGLGSLPGLAFLPTPGGGCTSITARLDDGGFAYGRNLDFAGVGVWDRHPMLLSVAPAPGSRELRHLVVGADGLLFGGVTGVNEKGITFAVHQSYSRDFGARGVPVAFLGELVLREARSLDEAVEILRVNRPASLWTFVLTDLGRGEAAAVEASRTAFRVRRYPGRFLVQTNHAMHDDTRASENAPFGIEANSLFRMELALRSLESGGAEGAPALARILSHQEDPEGRLSAYHDVLKALTLQTALFEARPGKAPMLYLSTGEAPSASGRFAAFRLDGFWTKTGIRDAELVDLATAPPSKRLRQREAAEAYRLYFDAHRPLEAARLLEAQHTFDAALFRSVALLNAGRFAESLAEAEAALADPAFLDAPSYARASAERVRLAALLRLSRVGEARALAARLLETRGGTAAGPGHKPLLDLARRILAGRTVPGWMLDPRFDFFSGDLDGRKD